MAIASIKFSSDYLIEALERYRRQHRGRYIGLAIKVLAFMLLAPIAVWMLQQGHIAIAIVFAALRSCRIFGAKTRRQMKASAAQN